MINAPVAADPQFRRDVIEGLRRERKSIPPRWFYDDTGSALFDEITRVPEYYPTRVETALLGARADAIAAAVGAACVVVEYGAGSATKTPLLLGAIEPAAYLPVDISGDFMRRAASGLSAAFPGLPVIPVEADFAAPFDLPDLGPAFVDVPRLGFFPGSTIGNFDPADAVDLLRQMRATLGRQALLLIGVDRIKPVATLIAAYDDAAGVTARFNRNLLARINRELAGTIATEAFEHQVRWNDDAARIEMHLAATRDLTFAVAGERFTMRAGETIHTESSHKYGPRDARLLLRSGGWEPVAEWTDAGDAFALILAKV